MRPSLSSWLCASICALSLLLARPAHASTGDRLPEFKHCVELCKQTNCVQDGPSIALHNRLLLWDCPSECDYTCQHVITDARLARDPPLADPVVQFHGKWPFHRFLGMQEPFSVLFSLFNYLAHSTGMARLRDRVPASYPLRTYYLTFGYLGLASWVFSMIFHARDCALTETLDYFAAGASVLYNLYLSVVRVFRLDGPAPRTQSVRRLWTLLCVALYIAHVTYLTAWRWDYTYNMAANVAVGALSNVLWTGFSVARFRSVRRAWAAWPGMIVAWIVLAMSLELLDFPPWGGMVDAHSLWHLGTVLPTVWWYTFMIKDAQEDLQGSRVKQ